jgi:hypothetical protein
MHSPMSEPHSAYPKGYLFRCHLYSQKYMSGLCRTNPACSVAWIPNKQNKNKGNGSQPCSMRAPRQFQASISKSHRFRFITTAAIDASVTSVNLAAFQSLVVSSTSVTPLIDRVKIQSVEIFGSMGQSLAPVTVSLEWVNPSGAFGSSTKIHTDTSMTASSCAYIKCVPDARSISGQWVNVDVANYVLFKMVAPINSIIDIVLQFVLSDGAATNPLAGTFTAPVNSIGVLALTDTTVLGLPSL